MSYFLSWLVTSRLIRPTPRDRAANKAAVTAGARNAVLRSLADYAEPRRHLGLSATRLDRRPDRPDANSLRSAIQTLMADGLIRLVNPEKKLRRKQRVVTVEEYALNIAAITALPKAVPSRDDIGPPGADDGEYSSASRHADAGEYRADVGECWADAGECGGDDGEYSPQLCQGTRSEFRQELRRTRARPPDDDAGRKRRTRFPQQRPSSLPDNFPTPAIKATAVALGHAMEVVEHEATKFRYWYLARGITRADWSAEFFLWLARDDDRKRSGVAGGAQAAEFRSRASSLGVALDPMIAVWPSWAGGLSRGILLRGLRQTGWRRASRMEERPRAEYHLCWAGRPQGDDLGRHRRGRAGR